jgi:hypothetical protein
MPDSTACSKGLSDNQMARILTAVASVDWRALDASYKPDHNPCSCWELLIDTLTVDLKVSGSDVVSYATDWCDDEASCVRPRS